MYCVRCGSQYADKANFCGRCGAQLSHRSVTEPSITTQMYKKTQGTLGGILKNKKVIAVSVVAAIILCLVLLVVVVVNNLSESVSSSGGKGFDVEFSEEGISDFLEDVCKRVDGKAEVTDPNYNSPASMYGGCIVSTIDVKRDGKVAEEVQIRFYNEKSSDRVSKAQKIFYSFESGGFSARDYENLFECEKEFLVALEKTVVGRSCVEDHISSYEEMLRAISNCEEGEIEEIASYELSDDISVLIEVENNYSWGSDRIYYTLVKDES